LPERQYYHPDSTLQFVRQNQVGEYFNIKYNEQMSLVNLLIDRLNSQPHIFNLGDRHSSNKIENAVNILRTQ
jgi:hypothetical protein